MKKRLWVILFLFLIFASARAQTDTLFWFAVPYATLSHRGPLGTEPLTATLTLTATDRTNITTVTIEQAYSPQIPKITVTIDPGVSLTQNVNFTEADLLKFSNNLYNSKSNSALLIRADHEITAYYEINKALNNPAIFALKGKNAIGTDFWTVFQNQWPNHDYDAPGKDPAFSQIVIVATEDNTDVTVRFKVPAFGYAANVDIPVHLDFAGQTFMFVPKANPADNNEPSILAADRLTGTHITSNKPIAMTLGDDSVQKSGAYDYMGDQHIPVKNAQNKSVIGYEYVVMKGKITDLGGGNNEKLYVLTTMGGTFIDVTHKSTGLTTTYGPFAAGVQLPVDLLSATNDYFVRILATNPVYVLHIAGFGDELGEAILPTIDGCTGSLSVSFTRSKNQAFYLNLMTKVDAIDSFYISINGGPPAHFLSSALFEQAGTSDWYVLKDANKLMSNVTIPTGAVTRIFNTKNVFHLGYFNGVNSGGGCVYGYFSDYNELEATATVEDQGSVFQVCGVDTVQLRAKGGLSYHWSPTEYLDDPNAQNPVLHPPGGGFSQVFAVDIEQPCNGTITKYVLVIIPETPNAFMTVDADKGCAPIDIKMKDASSGATNYVLDLGDGSGLILSASPINLTHNYNNLSDTIINYDIIYTVGNDDGCYDYYTDTISVYPNVTSDFKLVDWNDTTVCHATTVGFRSTSVGNTDTYLWQFGDGSSDIDTAVTHTYNNAGINDTVFHVNLVATSPFGCKDTSDIVDVRVYPFIFSSFSVDSALRCSPAKYFINPGNSVGVDTFYWSISDINKSIIDSSFKKLNEIPVILNHGNISHPTPDTIRIAMIAENRFGCTDTATTRNVIVYPEVHSDFTINKNNICDSVDVAFTNKSKGFNLIYDWDFGNGTSKSDTISMPFSRYFFNRSNHDTTYTIRLITTSDYYCEDESTVPLTVYPFVNANFAVDYSSNCSPLDVEIINISQGGDEFNWNYGDGNLFTNYIADTLYHQYENNTDNDTTFYIHLHAKNNQGCIDSARRSVLLFPRVIAAFGFNSPNQGCNPLNVSFNNSSKGKDLNYIWDFGDATYSTSEFPPPRLYQNATAKDTTYHVNLTVMNLAGCDSSITHPVEVYSKVTADFTIARLDSCSPFKIAVSNFSSGGITEFVWKYTPADSLILYDFSDPDIPLYRNQTMAPISYPIILTTKNSHGCTAIKNNTVQVFPEIHADFHPDIQVGCQPLPVHFANNTNISAGTFFYWNFDDGRTSNIANPPVHTFNNISNLSQFHSVKLQATSQYGCYDDTVNSVEVFPYIFAKFSFDKPAICSDEGFSIDRTNSQGAIDHYNWQFGNAGIGDGEKSDPVFDHTYSNWNSAVENHTIRLTVTNPQGCDTAWTENMVVYPQVRAAFDMDHNETCYPEATGFSNHSQPAVPLNYYWDFGDGSSSVNSNPTHAYKNFSRTADHVFLIHLTATSQFGCDSTISRTVTIHPKPLADFNFPLSVDCPPFTVPFTNNSFGTNLNYGWDFDNGNTSTQADPVETFDNSGSAIDEKFISLISTTSFLCSDTVSKPIRIYPRVQVDFSASKWKGCNPLEINFDGSATNENEYYWFIDDKVFSNYEDPFYRFVNETGSNRTYHVKFKANSINGCSDDTTKLITLYPQPRAEFLPYPQAQEFNTDTDATAVNIHNTTGNQNAWQYQWNFGDGTLATTTDPAFDKLYGIWGDIHDENRIPVILIATNPANPECADTMMHYVIINPPEPKVELGPDIAGCMPLTVQFPANTRYNYADSYQWDFGFDNLTGTESNPSSIVYDTAGVYIVRLAVEGDGGTNWDYKKVTVYPKPVVNFSFTPDYAWLGSQTEPGTAIKYFNTTLEGDNYLWEFGDGETSSEFQPSHEYQKVGKYYITLTSESGRGCMDTKTSELPVVVEGKGRIEFPTVFSIIIDDAAEEYYDPGVPDPRIFRPVAEGVEEYRLEIYSRWGELIYTSNEISKGWNGFIKGSPAKQDVYVWRVTATFTNGRPYVKAGDVTLLVRQTGQ